MDPLSGLRRRWRRTGRGSRVADGRIRRVRRRAGVSVRFSRGLKRGTGMNGPLVRHSRPGLTPADSEARRQSWPRRTRSGLWGARSQAAAAQVGVHSSRKIRLTPQAAPGRRRRRAGLRTASVAMSRQKRARRRELPGRGRSPAASRRRRWRRRPPGPPLPGGGPGPQRRSLQRCRGRRAALPVPRCVTWVHYGRSGPGPRQLLSQRTIGCQED